MTELTVAKSAELALKFDDVKTKAVALVEESKRITEITDPASYKECHAARMKLKEARIATEKAGKAAREDSILFQKTVIAKEKELIDIMQPEEERLGKLQKAVDDEAERVKAEKAKAEKDRIDAINARFAEIKAMPLAVVGKPSAEIQAQLEKAEAIDPDSFDEDMRPAATYEKRLVVASLRALYDGAVAAEAEEVRKEQERQAEREELERLRAANAEREAREQQERTEREAKAAQEAADAAKAREAQERADRERREREDAAAQAERDRKAAEQAEELRIQREQEEAARAERERIANEEAERRGREMAAAAEARQKETDRLAAEKAAFEAEKAAALEAKRLEELENLTLEQAANDALVLLETTYVSTDWQTKNLRSVLERIEANREAVEVG